ncbi:MAG: PadR family transcriptional regulator [Chloroflexi bacterium]|nr:PadR family transcriptional regulator [Chloroflexota bacterium]
MHRFHHDEPRESFLTRHDLPPWLRGREHFHHRWQEDMPPGGPPFGPGGRGPKGFRPGPFGRRFGRGDLKYVILDMLQERPRHGYDIIQALEQRFEGFYSPSPGSVYPTLQLLEDQGYVTSNEQDGRRVYSLTDAGRQFLNEQAATVSELRDRAGSGWGPRGNSELRQLMNEVRQLGQYLFGLGARGAFADPDTVRRLRAVVTQARADITAIFTERQEPPSTTI